MFFSLSLSIDSNVEFHPERGFCHNFGSFPDVFDMFNCRLILEHQWRVCVTTRECSSVHGHAHRL